jgi:trimeric autotransporter adhesin
LTRYRHQLHIMAALAPMIVLGLAPSPARAAVGGTCAFAGSTVSITTSSGTSATIVRSGNAIELNGVPCDTATVSNTDLIAVSSPEGFDMVTIDLSGGPFAPGATDEGDGSSEIEMTVGFESLVTILGSDQADHIAIDDFEDGLPPDSTANLNADEAVSDDDISADFSSNYALIDTGAGDDTVELAYTDAHVNGGDGADLFLIRNAGDVQVDGGAGYDMASWAANSSPISLYDVGTLFGVSGDFGADQSLTSVEEANATMLSDEILVGEGANVHGLAGDDLIYAYSGTSTVTGGAGLDSLTFYLDTDLTVRLPDHVGLSDATRTRFGGIESIKGTDGDDLFVAAGRDYRLNGGGGLDTYSLADALHGVRVDLGTGDVSDGDHLHAIESVVGSPFADQITGNDLKNFLVGRAGDDVIRGLDAGDLLLGGEGDDLLDGGPGADECHGGPGTDTLLSC